MGNKKVSIVMPVYNAVDYIDATLGSLMAQSYKNFELILIDDGAQDGTGEKCQQYAAEYDNVKYYKQDHKGTGAARNFGIQLASGDYIAFVDHDDKCSAEFLRIMVDLAEKEDLDIVKCGFHFEAYTADGETEIIDRTPQPAVCDRERFLAAYDNLFPYFAVYIWNALYKADFLRKSAVRFDETMLYGNEDLFFNISLVPHIKQVGFTDACLYFHYKRTGQSSSADFHEDLIHAHVKCMELEEKILLPLYNKDKWEDIYLFLYAKKITSLIAYCCRTSDSGDEAIRRTEKALTAFRNLCLPERKLDFGVRKSVPAKFAGVLILFNKQQYAVLARLWILLKKFSSRSRFKAENLYREPFQIDFEYFQNVLKGKNIHYRVRRVRLGELKYRYWDGRGSVPVNESAPFRYLQGDKTAYADYAVYQRLHGFPVPSADKFDALIQSVKENGFKNENIIIVNRRNWLKDGQHRACILTFLYGPDHEVEVLEITVLSCREIIKSYLPEAVLDLLSAMRERYKGRKRGSLHDSF